MLSTTVLFGAVIGLVTATATTVTTVRTTTLSTCTYNSGSGGSPPTPIPTHNVRTSITSWVTNEAITVPSTVTVTVTAPTTITVTDHTAIEYTAVDETITVPTTTRYFGTQKTVATATFAATVCSGGVKPVTVTEYTGTYTPLPGQPTTPPTIYPTAAFCTTSYIRTNILSPTTTLSDDTTTVTKTLTRSTTVTSPTTTSTSTLVFGTQYTYLATVTATYTSYTPLATTETSTIPCVASETVTRTLAAECAPTNIVGSIDGSGLQSGQYADRTSVVYTGNLPWSVDASECCQACVDSPGCGASIGGGGACGLHYTASEDGDSPVCDIRIFTFTSSEDVAPGQGLLIQKGCGWVEHQG
ncbi:hypothetical protein GGS20DRAFT_533912 [Poronia punctata]|nr:hypothetical protein GGS20DRAFT_533912 [Poronia punctata]